MAVALVLCGFPLGWTSFRKTGCSTAWIGACCCSASVDQMTQRIESFPEIRLQVEQVARLPGLVIGVAVLVVVVARSVC
ncbi:hypothetical protein M0R45_026135 [Rubus argutus]|uniref:Uncharacterized protein n=1 Tax=Rubus argutus TaxID=59490 RepID=A0AAW1X084_RUBAR